MELSRILITEQDGDDIVFEHCDCDYCSYHRDELKEFDFDDCDFAPSDTEAAIDAELLVAETEDAFKDVIEAFQEGKPVWPSIMALEVFLEAMRNYED